MKTFEVSHVKINDKPMIRDMHSKAIISTDRDGLRAYRDKMAQMEAINQNKDRLDAVEQSMSEIKEMVSQLLKSRIT